MFLLNMIFLSSVRKASSIINSSSFVLLDLVPPQFVDDNSFIQQRTVIEGSTLQLSCSATGRPKPSITWFYRTAEGRHISCKYIYM